ncbi:MAG: hypothetical protein ACT4PM_01955 [Gemmatimonadales bacterium]
MTIDPKDLSPEVRQGLLDQLRSHVGEARYRELMSQVDEDQVLTAILKQAPAGSSPKAEPRVPWWLKLVGTLGFAGLLGLGAWLFGTDHWAGRTLAGATIGVALSLAYPMSGFAIGAFLGGALGGALGKKLDAAFGGAMIGGLAVTLIRVAVEWLAKQMADLTRIRY